MRSPRPVLIVLGALLALLGLGVLAAGVAVTWAHTTQRDADGFYTSPDYTLSSAGHAVTTDEVRLVTHPGDWLPDPGDLTFRVTVTPTDAAGSVFVGLAPTDDVADFLGGVAHDRIVRVGPVVDEVVTTSVAGTAPPDDPTSAALWVAMTEGSGTQTLTVDAAPGDWAVVVMNADGSAGVDVTASAGIRSGLLLPIGIVLLVAAGVLLLVATAVLVAGAGTPSQPSSSPGAQPPVPGPVTVPADAGPYPVHLTGVLDPELSRGMWLVKWLLAIPHVVVLALLWVSFVLLTVAAGVAILFTGRYPRSIFDFNVGVLRWTWRVTYYAYGVLGSDRYPPFTLAPDPTYPATLEVDYPGELSRGLVLVKSWLLAIPHWVIVGIFTGGLVTWTVDTGAPEGWQTVLGSGLVGVLVVVAGVVLLVRGRYPTAVFDLVMGLQRWVYRVMAYAALMTDEYPPFRLDLGGHEPPTGDPGPPPGPTSDTGMDREATRV